MKHDHAQTKRMLFSRLNRLAMIPLLAIPALVLTAHATGQQSSQAAPAHQAWPPAGAEPAPDHLWVPARYIDFSSKHNVLIKNEDGSLTPMGAPYFKSALIAPGVWQILSDGDYSYLIEGDNEALAIDSTYGAGNIREYMQTLTEKPVRYVANTHDHFDHTANDSYFDRAFMSEETRKKATIPYPSFAGITFPRNYPVTVIGDGYVFHLGNRDIEVFEIPNHTLGDLAYLDRRSRILFSGDVVMTQGIGLNPSFSVAQFAHNMSKLEAHRSEFDKLAAGAGILDASWVDKFLAIAQYVLAGHEGEPVKPQQPRPVAAPADPSAPVIYNRRAPRPPDMGGQSSGQPNENLRRMTYEGCTITYDIRHITN